MAKGANIHLPGCTYLHYCKIGLLKSGTTTVKPHKFWGVHKASELPDMYVFMLNIPTFDIS